MATFNAKCPYCSSAWEVPNAYVGKEVKCLTCEESFVAQPSLEREELPAAAAAASEDPVPSESLSPRVTVESEEQATTSTGYAILGRYSLNVSNAEPVLHWLFRIGATVFIFLTLFEVWQHYDPYSEFVIGRDAEGRWYWWNKIITLLAITAAAQVVQYLHSIAWNTQEARRERIES